MNVLKLGTYLKLKMYSSLIIGQLSILTGLYLFIANSDKTMGRFVILMGLISTVIGIYLCFVLKKKETNTNL